MSEREGVRPTDDQDELLEREKRENVIRLAFGGDRARFDEFCRVVRDAIPGGTGVVVRGSAVTGLGRDPAPAAAGRARASRGVNVRE